MLNFRQNDSEQVASMAAMFIWHDIRVSQIRYGWDNITREYIRAVQKSMEDSVPDVHQVGELREPNLYPRANSLEGRETMVSRISWQCNDTFVARDGSHYMKRYAR